MLTYQTIIISILLLLILPACAGYGLIKMLGLYKPFYSFYLTGSVFLWAGTEIILLPLIYFETPFSQAYIPVLLFYILAALSGLYMYWASNKKKINPFVRLNARSKTISRQDYLLLGINGVITSAVILISLSYYCQTNFDSHSIVSAVDMVNSDRIFLSHSSTGQALKSIPGIYSADLASPWSFTYAFLAFLTGTSPLIAAHMILPVQLILLCSCIYLEFTKVFSFRSVNYQVLFIGIIWACQLLGFSSAFTSQAQLMTRIWQGPALISALGIPLMIYMFFGLFAKPFSWKSWFLLGVSDLALCFMDRSGVILGLMMILAFCTAYAMIYRDVRIILFGGGTSLCNVICWALADSVNNGIHFTGDPSAFSILESLRESRLLYYGSGRMLVLGLACAIILSIISAKESRRLLYPLLAILFLIVYPVVYELAMAGLPSWNMYKLFPEYLLIALTLTKFIEKASPGKNKAVGLVIICLLLFLSGSNPFDYGDFSETANLEKLNPRHKEIYDYILARDASPSCIMADELVYEARQYSPDFVLPYSLNEDGSVAQIDTALCNIPAYMAKPFLGSFKLAKVGKNNNYNYIIVHVRDHMRVQILRSSKYWLVKRMHNYLIYYRYPPAEYELYKQNMALLNIDIKSVYKAVKQLDTLKLESILQEALESSPQDQSQAPAASTESTGVSSETSTAESTEVPEASDQASSQSENTAAETSIDDSGEESEESMEETDE